MKDNGLSDVLKLLDGASKTPTNNEFMEKTANINKVAEMEKMAEYGSALGRAFIEEVTPYLEDSFNNLEYRMQKIAEDAVAAVKTVTSPIVKPVASTGSTTANIGAATPSSKPQPPAQAVAQETPPPVNQPSNNDQTLDAIKTATPEELDAALQNLTDDEIANLMKDPEVSSILSQKAMDGLNTADPDDVRQWLGTLSDDQVEALAANPEIAAQINGILGS